MIDIQRDFAPWAIPIAWEWANSQRRAFADDFFPRTVDEFVEFSERWKLTYGVWRDEVLSGVIAMEFNSPCTVTAHILLAKRVWGTPAAELRRAAELLFGAHPAVNRIQAFVPAWNRLALALAIRIGGTVEGTLRGATMRGGKPADVVMVGITRGEFYGRESRTGV